MKLLFDENLSPELVETLADKYPDSKHVHDCGLGMADDGAVWEYAKSFGFAVVTKDLDFYQRSMRVGSPPKVIWLRLGTARPLLSRCCCVIASTC